MVKTRDIKTIVHSKAYKINYKSIFKDVNIESIDTETLDGYANLILYSNNNEIKFKHIFNFNELLKLIFSFNSNNLYTFFNLDYDTGATIKFLLYD